MRLRTKRPQTFPHWPVSGLPASGGESKREALRETLNGACDSIDCWCASPACGGPPPCRQKRPSSPSLGWVSSYSNKASTAVEARPDHSLVSNVVELVLPELRRVLIEHAVVAAKRYGAPEISGTCRAHNPRPLSLTAEPSSSRARRAMLSLCALDRTSVPAYHRSASSGVIVRNRPTLSAKCQPSSSCSIAHPHGRAVCRSITRALLSGLCSVMPSRLWVLTREDKRVGTTTINPRMGGYDRLHNKKSARFPWGD